MQREMMGFLILCACLLFGLISCFGFLAWLQFVSGPKQSETNVGHQEEEATGREDDSQATASEREDDSRALASERKDDRGPSVSEYNVFLSFRGPDSRQDLADILYSDMTTAGIRVFRDNDELEIGDEISKILLAVKSSKICVPIFSETFAASVWCLREVEAMVELGKTIMPIFYTASPDDVKQRTELFKEDLRKHVKKHGREQVKKWEDALKAAGKIMGREVNATGYAEFSKSFVRALLIKLRVNIKSVSDYLIKRDNEEEAVTKLLDIDTEDVRLIGIYGMGGIGKTTLAKVVFNQLSARFDCCSFLENIQEALRCNGPEYLLRWLSEDLDPKLKCFQMVDYLRILEENFCRRKVLIVLDDINKGKQIESITGLLRYFGSGSRIVITTRDKRVFTRETWAFEMKEMNNHQALRLFSRHAFRGDSPPSDYQIHSNEVVSLTGGVPLAIEVIGSLLHQREEKIWKATIKKLKAVPNKDVKDKLKISFDALDDKEQQIFLDIACFLVGQEISSPMYMWEACEFHPDVGIEVLVSMCLVTVERNHLSMHGLIRDLGREIVREECFSDPAKRSRIWSRKEALEVLKIKQGKEKVEVLFLHEPGGRNLTNEQSSSFCNLRLLKLVERNMEGNFKDLLSKLKWLSWHQCPPLFSATNLCLESLVVLDLSDSSVDENWTGWSLLQTAKNLKVLDLTNCCNLASTPDLSSNNSLERLILYGCCILAEFHSSIGKLKRLKHLNLTGCSSLRGLPEEFGSLEDLEEILVEGSGDIFHLPESIGSLLSLSVIQLHRVEITRVPYSIGGLENLTLLSMRNCTILERLPNALGNLKSLLELDLSSTKVRALPNSVGRLVNLRSLRLGSTEIEDLPDTIGDLKLLLELDLSFTKIRSLPNSVGQLVNLESLNLGSTAIEELPDTLGDLKSLVHLYMSFSKVSVLPNSVGRLVNLQTLSLVSTEIDELPDTVGDLNSLVSLSLSCTKVSVLPDSVGRLVELRNLILDSTKIEELPDSLGNMMSLEMLDMRSSELTTLPDSLGDLCKLSSLLLDKCKIRKLPGSIGMLTGLGMLSAEKCKLLTEVPVEIGNISALRFLNLSHSGIFQLPQTINQLLSLHSLSLNIMAHDHDRSSVQKEEVSHSSFQWMENLTDLSALDFGHSSLSTFPFNLGALNRLTELRLRCARFKCIPQLPSTLLKLTLIYVTSETKLPDFSNLRNLTTVKFMYCSLQGTPDGLGELPMLQYMEISHCTKELVEFVCLLGNLVSLTIAHPRSHGTLLDLRRLRNLTSLNLTSCKELVEIRGLGELESLQLLQISHCPCLEMVGDLSELKRLFFVKIQQCPKLGDIEGLGSLFLKHLDISGCDCAAQYFNQLELRVYG